ncbi:MAG: hypothetical protein NTZ38_03530 [Candidatus Taylorbacteria bacterium]|nr:hypothetical protein [Candidatus Taylorbacteria bacterium]
MFNIGQFIKRFHNIHLKEVSFRIIVQEELKKEISIDIPPESISVKSSVIYLKGLSQGARSAIFIKKRKIIEGINKTQQSYTISDIR